MELNPIKAISAELERLVIEHGSAVIQEKHIALLKEQLTLLSEKFSTLDLENQKLVTDNAELKKKIQIYEDSNKPIFHNNFFWLPNNETVYCPSCYGKDKNLVPMVTYDYQATEFHTTKRFRCPVCKFHTDKMPHPNLNK
jgi:hypothetical protein